MTQSDMSRVIVDRIENGVAVLEGERGSLEVPASRLPAAAGEGSVVRVEVRADDDGSSHISLALDPNAQATREAEMVRLRDRIAKGPDGDIVL